MAAENVTGRLKLLRKLFWSRAGILLFGMSLLAVLGLILAGAIDKDPLRATLFAVATGVLASTVFTVAQLLVTADIQGTVLAETVTESLESAFADLRSDIRNMDVAFLPTHTFGSSRQPDPGFNSLLTQDLRASDFYYFRGLSSRHAAARIMLAGNQDCESHIIIADPLDQASLQSRLEIMALRRPNRELDEITHEMNRQLELGLIGLFCARRSCARIELMTTPTPTLDRFEIFRDSIWVTLADEAQDNLRDYRRTHRFQAQAMIYAMQRRDFRRVRGAENTTRLEIRSTTTNLDFLDIYHTVAGVRLSIAELKALEVEFLRFKDSFATAAKLE
ncbi:hypothetical protein AB0893_06200 [Micromonospora aurantiaca]|uniref:hypothetical protein n=1 Tax=Micromonospora aurantiaca (nom. illeg.) TaxID=47850 RepID=UPI003454745C